MAQKRYLAEEEITNALYEECGDDIQFAGEDSVQEEEDHLSEDDVQSDEEEVCNESIISESVNVFEHAYSAGFHPSDILDSIASMRPNPGMVELITTLAKKGWKVILLTDANSVFVNHWLKTHDLENAITTVITNRAFWQNGRLYIEPCMRQNVCPKCPSNLCKSLALEKWCGQKKYDNIIYCGDGRNDFCPAVNLPENAVVFPRKGYTMDNLIKKDAASPNPQMKAKVVPWVDGFRILQEVFPENSKLIC